jgi:CRISPR system Cascade subunit CasB
MTKPKTEEADQQAFMLALFNEYSQLSNGDKASIRRMVEPDDLQTNPVFYRLILQAIGSFKEPEKKANARVFFNKLSNVSRLVFFLPFLKHQANNKSLGAVFKEKKISERRLFLVMRSEYPEDLKHLRRLCQQFKDESVDGVKLSNQLLYWGKDKSSSERSKRQLMRDFYLSLKPDENTVVVET